MNQPISILEERRAGDAGFTLILKSGEQKQRFRMRVREDDSVTVTFDPPTLSTEGDAPPAPSWAALWKRLARRLYRRWREQATTVALLRGELAGLRAYAWQPARDIRVRLNLAEVYVEMVEDGTFEAVINGTERYTLCRRPQIQE